MTESKKETKVIKKENDSSTTKSKNKATKKSEKPEVAEKTTTSQEAETSLVAVIETGSKQYVIKDGDILDIEKISGDKDGKVIFDKVLLLSDGKETTVGTPFIDGATINGTILNQYKDKKKIVFKFKKKTGYKRFKGHRQSLTTIKFS
jgi:large subunit ribosomal protein L21